MFLKFVGGTFLLVLVAISSIFLIKIQSWQENQEKENNFLVSSQTRIEKSNTLAEKSTESLRKANKEKLFLKTELETDIQRLRNEINLQNLLQEDLQEVIENKEIILSDLQVEISQWESQLEDLERQEKAEEEEAQMQPTSSSIISRPKNCPKGQVLGVIATGYSSSPDEAWGNPYLTYTQTWVHWGTVAVDPNIIPLGCNLTINAFPGTIFTAEDIGGRIQGYHIDIWFPTKDKALEWGVRNVEVTIY